MRTSCGNKTGVGVGCANPREFNKSICICPTQGPSLQVTLPCSPGGLPAKEAAALRGRPTAPPRPFPAGCGAFPFSGGGPESDPSWLPRHPFPTAGVSPEYFQGSSASTPPGLPSTSLSSLRVPLSPPPAPGLIRDTGCRFFPPRRLSSGAHLARPPSLALFLS